MPDGAGRFTIRDYTRDYHFRGTQVGEAIFGVMDKPGQKPIEIALPFRFPTFDKMRKGDWIISVAGREKSFYTGLQVTRDPGVPLVYSGFILLIAGCWVTFFMSHQKVLIDVRSSTKSSRIKIFGSANRNKIGFELYVRKFEQELQQQ